MSIWDFNIAWGNCEFDNIHTGHMTDKWVYLNNNEGLGHKMPFWFQRLMEDELYVNELKSRYYQYRTSNYANVTATVDSLVYVLESGGAAERNFKAWSLWNKYVWPNYYTSSSYKDEINYLKNWIDMRIKWLDSQLFSMPTTSIQSEGEAGVVNNSHPVIYSIDGLRRKQLQHGLNILRHSNGRVIKIYR